MKTSKHLIVILLIPCLMVDPALASYFSSASFRTPTKISKARRRDFFTEQVVVQPALFEKGTASPHTSAAIARKVGESLPVAILFDSQITVIDVHPIKIGPTIDIAKAQLPISDDDTLTVHGQTNERSLEDRLKYRLLRSESPHLDPSWIDSRLQWAHASLILTGGALGDCVRSIFSQIALRIHRRRHDAPFFQIDFYLPLQYIYGAWSNWEGLVVKDYLGTLEAMRLPGSVWHQGRKLESVGEADPGVRIFITKELPHPSAASRKGPTSAARSSPKMDFTGRMPSPVERLGDMGYGHDPAAAIEVSRSNSSRVIQKKQAKKSGPEMREQTDFSLVLREYLPLLEKEFKRQVRHSIEDGVKVNIPSDFIRQWVRELVLNAWAEQKEREIKLTLTSNSDGISTLEVINQGGIAEDLLRSKARATIPHGLHRKANGAIYITTEKLLKTGESFVAKEELARLPAEELPFIGWLSRGKSDSVTGGVGYALYGMREALQPFDGTLHAESSVKAGVPITIFSLQLPSIREQRMAGPATENHLLALEVHHNHAYGESFRWMIEAGLPLERTLLVAYPSFYAVQKDQRIEFGSRHLIALSQGGVIDRDSLLALHSELPLHEPLEFVVNGRELENCVHTAFYHIAHFHTQVGFQKLTYHFLADFIHHVIRNRQLAKGIHEYLNLLAAIFLQGGHEPSIYLDGLLLNKANKMATTTVDIRWWSHRDEFASYIRALQMASA